MENIKKKSFIKPLIWAGVIIFLLCFFGLNYNDLIRSRNQVDNRNGTIELVEQKRLDKITMLTDAVTGSQIQEQEVFKKIADGRKTYQAAGSEEEKQAASQQISTNVLQLPRLMQEAYPDLKSNGNVQKLMDEMVGIENELGSARKDYNTVATNYNTNIQSFPKFIFAGAFGFKEKPLYKSTEAANSAPKTDTTDRLRNK